MAITSKVPPTITAGTLKAATISMRPRIKPAMRSQAGMQVGRDGGRRAASMEAAAARSRLRSCHELLCDHKAGSLYDSVLKPRLFTMFFT